MNHCSSSLRLRIRAASPVFRKAAALLVLLLVSESMSLTKKKFDFVIGVDGNFKAAMAAAAKSASGSKRFHMFFPDGEYDIGSLTGDANQMTTFPTANVSMIGQSEDKTVVFNKSSAEGISTTATLYFNGADNLYMQDMSVLNKAIYGNTAQYSATGRHVAIMERSDKMIYKFVRLLSTQDTYYTKGTRTYWEGGQIHGTTDFICGGGDIIFNGVLLWVMKVSAIVAPATASNWGYVFKDCTIDGTVSGFNLGRSWGTARTAYINTVMKKLPSSAAWGDMGTPHNPKLFAEYKSVTASGSLVDLSKRRKSFTDASGTVTLNPVLTDSEAAKYTVADVLAGSDNWQPQVATQQVAAPAVTREGKLLKWNDDAKALCWAVFKNGKYLANVSTNSFDATALAKGDVITVRAANEMGGLGASSTPLTIGATTSIRIREIAQLRHNYDSRNKILHISGERIAGQDIHLYRPDGTLALALALSHSPTRNVRLSLVTLPSGTYLLSYGSGGGERAGSIVIP